MHMFEIKLAGSFVAPHDLKMLSEDVGRVLTYDTNENGKSQGWIAYNTEPCFLTARQLAYWAPRINPVVSAVRIVPKPVSKP